MPCNTCGSWSSCNCQQAQIYNICDPCNSNTGCPFQLDADCVIYHKNNNQLSELTNLGLTNGATLELILETIDSKLGFLDILDWSLPCLRAEYTINTLEQFAEAVDTELCQIKTDITNLTLLVNTPITPVDSTSIDLGVSGVNNHTLTASLIVSPNIGNQLSVLGNGVFVTPQTLSVNFSTKEVTISDGNTIALGSLCGCEDCTPFQGTVASDPVAPSEGDYWFNTVSNQLKIFVNGVTKIITTT